MRYSGLLFGSMGMLIGLLACSGGSDGSIETPEESAQKERRRTASLPTATGSVGDALVVVDDAWWNTGDLDSLIKPFVEEVYGLNQIEPQFDVIQIDPSEFNRIFRTTRNMLIIERTSVDTLYWTPNKWARGQSVLQMGLGSSIPSEYILDRAEEAANRLYLEESRRIAQALRGSISESYRDKVRDLIGAALPVSKDFRLNQEASQFCWFTRQKPKAQQGLLVYEVPVPSGGDLLQELSWAMDSVTKRYVLGELPNTYMEIERRFPVKMDWADGRFGGVIRGLWRMENDFMGGPFVAVFSESEGGDRIQIAHAYTFAPGEDKRNLMWELEVVARELLKP